jgi:8-oxo-dGTP diphosphatase
MLKVTCALIINDQKLLITQNSPESDHPFKWEFPGGKIKQGEDKDHCIIREIKEELNISISVIRRLKPVVFDYGFKKIELIPFLCQIQSGTIQLKEHVDFKWIVFSDLKVTDFSGADRNLINEKHNIEILKKYIGEQMNDTG